MLLPLLFLRSLNRALTTYLSTMDISPSRFRRSHRREAPDTRWIVKCQARAALGYPEATLEVFGRHSWVTQRLDEGWTYTDISHYTLNDAATLQRLYSNVTKATRRSVSRIADARKKR